MKCFIGLAFILGLAGCATDTGGPVTKPPASTLDKQAAKELEAHYFADVTFKKGAKHLDAVAREEIAKVLQQAEERGKIKEVTILAWADQEYPSKEQKDLSRKAIRLAVGRAQYLEKIVRKLKPVHIETHNMAERPNFLQRWMGEEDARLKRAMIAAGLPTTADDVAPHKASHALIFVKTE